LIETQSQMKGSRVRAFRRRAGNSLARQAAFAALCEPFRVLGECRHPNHEQQQTRDAELKPEIFLVGHAIHPSIAFEAGAEPTKFG
jgi:hypothetical protein